MTETIIRKENKQTVIVIVGMHRSGTSLLAGLLKISGIYFSENLIPASNDNVKGFFEDAEIVAANVDFLKSYGIDYDGFDPLPKLWLEDVKKISIFKEKIKKIIKKVYGGQNCFAIKDPRISVLLPVYKEIFEELEIDDKYLVCMRDPTEIILSLRKRNNLAYKKSLSAIEAYLSSIKKNLMDRKSLSVSMEQVIANPKYQLAEIESCMGIKLTDYELVKKSILEFIEPTLRHENLKNNSSVQEILEKILIEYDDLENRSSTVIKEIKNDNQSLTDEVVKLTDEVVQLKENLSNLKNEIEMIKEENIHLNKLVEEKDSHIHDLNIKIINIERSLSWKVVKLWHLFITRIFPQGSWPLTAYLKSIKALQDFVNGWIPNRAVKLVKGLENRVPAGYFWDNNSSKIKDIDILFVNHQESRTGAPRIVFEVANICQKKRRVAMISLEKGSMHDEFNQFFDPVIYPEDLYPNWDNEKKAEEIIKKIQPKLVYVNSISTFRYAEAAKKMGIPVIFHVHELNLAFRIVFNERQKKEFKNYADYFIAVSQPVYDLLIHKYDCKPSKVKLINAFVDRKKIKEKSQLIQCEIIKKELKIRDEVVILGLGEFIYRKGADIFLKTAKRIIDSGRNCKFIWIGKNSMNGHFSLNIEEYKDYFTLINEKSNPFPYLKNIDILALPSREDPFPLVVLEAMALGIPAVIFKDAGGMSEALKDGGLSVDEINEDKYFNSIKRMVDDCNLRNKMGEAGRENQKSYDAEFILPQIEKIVDNILDKK